MKRTLFLLFLSLSICCRQSETLVQSEVSPAETTATESQDDQNDATSRAPRCVDSWTPSGRLAYRTVGCNADGGGVIAVRVPDASALRAVSAADATASEAAARLNADVVINANFFDPEHRPMGLVINGSRQLSAPRNVSWQSIFTVDEKGRREILLPEKWPSKRKVVTAVQAGPRLVVDSKVLEHKTGDPAPRTGICLKGRETILFVTAPDVRLDSTEIATLAAAPEGQGLGCEDAMLLDGGGSTQLFLREARELSFDADQVPVLLYVEGSGARSDQKK